MKNKTNIKYIIKILIINYLIIEKFKLMIKSQKFINREKKKL